MAREDGRVFDLLEEEWENHTGDDLEVSTVEAFRTQAAALAEHDRRISNIEGGVTTKLTVLPTVDGENPAYNASYLKDKAEVRMGYRVTLTKDDVYSPEWMAVVYVNGTQAGSTYYNRENTLHTTWIEGLAKVLSHDYSKTDTLRIVVTDLESGTQKTVEVTMNCIYAEVQTGDAFDISEVNPSVLPYIAKYAGAEGSTIRADLEVETTDLWGGNGKSYKLENITSSNAVKNVQVTDGTLGGVRKAVARININGGMGYSEERELQFLTVTANERSAVLVAMMPIVGAVQYEDYTLKLGVYAAGEPTAAVKVEITDADGNVRYQTEQEVRCSTLQEGGSYSGGAPMTYTFAVPSRTFEVRVSVNGVYNRTVTGNAEGSDMEWEARKTNLVLNLNAKGRSNRETTKREWAYTNAAGQTYGTTFEDVEFDAQSQSKVVNGWWNSTSLRLSGSAKATIDCCPLYDETQGRSGERGGGLLANGRTVAVKFRVNNITDKSQAMVRCWDETGRFGFVIRPDSIYANFGKEIVDEYSKAQTDSKNDRRFDIGTEIEVCFTIGVLYRQGVIQTPELKMYVNGEIAGSAKVSATTLSQSTARPIELLGAGGTLEVMYVKVWEAELTADEVLQSHTMEQNSQAGMLNLYNQNKWDLTNYDPSLLSEGVFGYAAWQSRNGSECAIVVTSDIREGVTDTKACDAKEQELAIYRFKNGVIDEELSVRFVSVADATAKKGLRVRVQGTSTRLMPVKNLRYDVNKACAGYRTDRYRWDNASGGWVLAERGVQALAIHIQSGDNACTLLTTKTNYNESTATRNLPNARFTEDATRYLGTLTDGQGGLLYPQLLTPPQKEDANIRQAIDGVPAIQFLHDLGTDTYTFTGKVDIITDKTNMPVFGFRERETDGEGNVTYAGDWSVEFRNNNSDVCNFKSTDLTRACVKDASGNAADDHLEYRFPDRDTQWGDEYMNEDGALQRLFDFLYNCWPDATKLNSRSVKGVVEPSDGSIHIRGVLPYYTADNQAGSDPVYSFDIPLGKTRYTRYVDFSKTDSVEWRKMKFYAELHEYMVVESAVLSGLLSHVLLWTDQRAKNQFFTHFVGDDDVTPYDAEGHTTGNEVVRLLPYDIDTSLRGDNDSRLRYDYTRLYRDAGIYDDNGSLLYTLLDACFGFEYGAMWDHLVRGGFLTYQGLKRYYADEEVDAYSSAIYNLDSNYKYLADVVENGSTQDQRFKAHGSAIEDLNWWVKNRLYFMGGQYYQGENGSDYTSEVLSLNLTTDATKSMAGARMEVECYERNWVNVSYGVVPVASAYVEEGARVELDLSGINITASDSRLIVYGHKQVKSLGDLSGCYVASIQTTGQLNVKDLRIGSTAEGYRNEVFGGFGEAVYGACEEVNVANCTALGDLSLVNFPVLKTIEARGCESCNACTLPTSSLLETAHLPGNLTELTVRNKPNLRELTIEGTSRLRNIDVENSSTAAALAVIDMLAEIYG